MTLLASDLNGRPIQAARPGSTHVLSITAASTALGAPVDQDTRVVRCVATTDCHLAIAPMPSADTGAVLLPAFTPEYFAVEGGADSLAVIRIAEDGFLYVTEME
ncbi:MAG: hypothetical protein RLO50_06130 [Azospirillaceae bacterium]